MASTITTTTFTTTNHRLHHHLRRHNHPITTLTFPQPSLPQFTPLKTPKFLTFSSLTPPPPTTTPQPQPPLPINTLLSLFTLTVKITRTIIEKTKSLLITPTPNELNTIQYLQNNVFCTLGPLFFAARSSSSAYLNTPLTVVAAGMAKWLDIYSGVLLVRVLLSWFPNIPWDRQPLSAIRDLCDPYLNLFRNIIPPVFDTLDISPLFAFTVLGVLGSILNSAKGM